MGKGIEREENLKQEEEATEPLLVISFSIQNSQAYGGVLLDSDFYRILKRESKKRKRSCC